jgi:hypothetical protein
MTRKNSEKDEQRQEQSGKGKSEKGQLRERKYQVQEQV